MSIVAKKGQAAPMVIDIMPANIEGEIQKAKQGRMALDMLFRELLVQGTDFDRIPGTDKPTLLKSGAELLCQVFHLAPGKMDMLSEIEDFQNGVLSYKVGVPIYHRDSGILVAYGIGAANSKEPKYRYRKSQDKEGAEIRVENPDPGGEQNTLVKMAAKRALTDGVLKATGASRMFTQDVEDYLMPEGASTKQKNYIRMLLKGKEEAPTLRQVLGLEEGDDIGVDTLTREQASQVIEALKGQPARAGKAPEAPRSAPKPAGNRQARVDWTSFWAKTREMGIEDSEVHQLAGAYAGKEVKSLKEIVATQEDLNKFLAYIEELSREAS